MIRTTTTLLTSLPASTLRTLFAGAFVVASGTLASAQSRTYTLDADFSEGVLSNVNFTAVQDQLQLDVVPGGAALDFCAVAATGRNTLVRFDANTGAILGEYRTAPVGSLRNPSRTAVDAAGNVWVGNRDEQTGGLGSVCRIGVCVGGTRVDANGTPNPNGEYLAPPFLYNTCVDRNGDGLIRTSRGLNNVLDWPLGTDGAGGSDGIVQDAFDEAIQLFQRTSGVQVRHVSVDASGDAWVGGYPNFPAAFNKISGGNGAILTTFNPPGCGGHGGIIDASNVLWSASLFDDSVLRWDTVTNTATCIPVTAPHALTRDSQGNIWVAQFDFNAVTKIAPDGTIFAGFPKRSGGGSFDRSIAVTFSDDNVWVGNSGVGPGGVYGVSRLDSNGGLRKLVNLPANGIDPRGIAVDGNGKLWVTNFGSNNAMRIDPAGDSDGLGAVDLVVDLGANAAPYNFGDFTGRVALGTIQPNGGWNVVYDSQALNTEYGRISWNASVPANTGFAVSFRAANSIAGLANVAYAPATNGQAFTGVFGQFVQIQADFTRANPSVTASPVLFDLTIEEIETPPPTDDDCKPGQRVPASLLVYPEFDNRRGDSTLLTVTNVDGEGSDVDVEFVYIGKRDAFGNPIDCLEVNRTRRLTPNDTLSLITRFDNPNQTQGYVYAFAKSRTTGQAIVHNALIGQALVINGIDVLNYSYNAYAFLGIGDAGEATDRDGDGIRDLNNVEYQCTSDETLIPRFLGQSEGIRSDLILINLTGGARFDALLDFLAYNDNEEAFSGQISFRCWDKLELSEISNVFTWSFLASTGHDLQEDVEGVETGWLRIDGNLANSTAASIPDPAFLALLVERIGPYGVADLPFETGTQTNGDLLPRGVLGDLSP
ncbi:MAG: hypothetical protein IPJ77_10550 [Planctomycetes bacterium]|nr:hypothetical protein [Planctomycetota bacterium]